MTSRCKVILLASDTDSVPILYHALKDEFQIDRVILEPPMSRLTLIKNRVRKLGYVKVFGQFCFQALVVPALRIRSKKRLKQIRMRHGFDTSEIEPARIIRVPSLNDAETVRLLKELNPDAIVVNVTRILSPELIRCVPAKFINIHAGITPLYRGVHGGYWALVGGKRHACGVTVHLVDDGIDTGGILGQSLIEPSSEDCFVTYPVLQLAAGLPVLKSSLREVLSNTVQPQEPPPGPSALWSHPTIWEYLWYGIMRRVW